MKQKEVLLGDHIHIKHGYPFASEHFVDEGEYLLLSPGNCHENGGLKLRGDRDKYYDGDFPEEYLLSKGDLLVVMTDLVQSAPLLGGAFIIPEDGRYLHNQRLGLVSVNPDSEIDKSYLYYLLNTHQYRGQVRGSASGATVRHTSPSKIYRCKVKVPDLDTQRRIASVLSAYDDLIENNRKRIKLLERAARLLYTEWFVRGRFPGHQGVKVKDGVPEGWEKCSFGSLVSQVKVSVKPEDVEGETPYIGLEHIPRRALVLDTWGNADEVTSNKFAFMEDDILFGKIRPYFHKVGFAITEGITSSDAIVMRPTEEAFGPLALAVASSDHFVAVASKSAKEGSKMPRADWKQMQAYPVLLPTHGILEQYNAIIRPSLSMMKVLAKQNIQLTRARDLLLPRLMSGKVRM